jgi:hypothetical protein
MTRSTDELTRLLTGVADDIVERERIPGPDGPVLWRRGRRTTWAARSAAAGIVAVLLLLVVTGGALLSGAPATVPAKGGALTYPEVVSDLSLQYRQVGEEPVFGLVGTVPDGPSTLDGAVAVERRGVLATLGTSPARGDQVVLSGDGSVPALAPDGHRVLTGEGVVDLTDGSLTRPIATDPVIRSRTGTRSVWSPDSHHVLVDTTDGAAVLDERADVAMPPATADRDVRAGGWRDDSTLIGVRPGDVGGLDIVTRRLTDPGWATVARVATDAVTASPEPSRVFAAPDGSRLLLVTPGAGAAGSVLVDARTGARIPFPGAGPSTAIAWDDCAPAWRAGQPLLALAGLREPATGRSVLRFSGHDEHGCIALAGNELTGAPAPGAAGAWQERAWRLWTAALPVGGVLLLAGTIWMVVALRRSRRHGDDFLPMVLGRLF